MPKVTQVGDALTTRQSEVLAYIEDPANARIPSFDSVALAFGIRKSAVTNHFTSLKKKGIVTYDENRKGKSDAWDLVDRSKFAKSNNSDEVARLKAMGNAIFKLCKSSEDSELAGDIMELMGMNRDGSPKRVRIGADGVQVST